MSLAPMNKPLALEVQNVNLVYSALNTDIEALRNVSFAVSDGEFVSIVGPSGCGKSSLLRLVLGLEKVTGGGIFVAGDKVSGPSKKAGCVFQSPVLLPWRNIWDNVMLPLDVLRQDRAVSCKRTANLLDMAGLKGFEQRFPYELSGGMQQRAAIVRALVHDPSILMMDEPFAALDAMTRETIALELQRIWMESRKTVVFITHSISEAVFLSDRIIVMSARPGRIVGEFENLSARPREFSDLAKPEMSGMIEEIRQRLNEASAITGNVAHV
ncbi:ABC transporter ATP-binding protein [Amorphus sp. MBR-141]